MLDSLLGRGIVSLESFSAQDLLTFLDIAQSFKTNLLNHSVKPSLRGKSVVNLFYEPSTRTKSSFEFAAKILGANVININPSSSSVVKGESLRDTLLTIQALGADAIVIRHPAEGAALFAANAVNIPIINAGDGAFQHPSQALLDLLTINQLCGNFNNLKIAFLGDILHSRVARSNFLAMHKLGFNIHAAAPKSLLPRFNPFPFLHFHLETRNAIANADIIYLLRIQAERIASALFPSLAEFARFFALSKQTLKLAKEQTVILHPGPQNKGVEIPFDLTYSSNSAIQLQVANGLAVRMALLHLSIKGDVP